MPVFDLSCLPCCQQSSGSSSQSAGCPTGAQIPNFTLTLTAPGCPFDGYSTILASIDPETSEWGASGNTDPIPAAYEHYLACVDGVWEYRFVTYCDPDPTPTTLFFDPLDIISSSPWEFEFDLEVSLPCCETTVHVSIVEGP